MDTRKELAISTAKILLDIEAVRLSLREPFTWASGLKSPIYCDNRQLFGYPNRYNQVKTGLARLIVTEYPEAEVIMGVATSGIPFAALAAEELSIQFGYVSSESKDHGLKNQIEGACVAGKKVVVVEDLISTAGSSVKVVNALRAEGAIVLGIASIFTYGMQKGIDCLEAAEVRNVSLTNIDVLLEEAVKLKYITAEDTNRVKTFLNNPSDPGWMDV